MRFALLVLTLASAAAQGLTHRQTTEMAYCALHGGGGLIGRHLYPNGKVSFSYISEPALDISDEKDPRDIYVAFWNHSRSAGELLVFLLFKSSHGKDVFIWNNAGHIVKKHGRMEVEDPLGGVYTYQKLQRVLFKLRRKPVTIMRASHAKPRSSICETPFDSDHYKE